MGADDLQKAGLLGYSVAQAGFGDLWVVNFGNLGVARIDPDKV